MAFEHGMGVFDSELAHLRRRLYVELERSVSYFRRKLCLFTQRVLEQLRQGLDSFRGEACLTVRICQLSRHSA